MAEPDSVDLSVVVAAVDADRSLEACLQALSAACRGLKAEVLVVGPASTPPPALGACPGSVFLPAPTAALVPELWAVGIQRACGRVVALTTGHMTVAPEWARALMKPLVAPVGGVGGPLDLAPASGLVDWAIFYLRYSAFLASRWPDGPIGGDIAGDNAAYLLEDLRRHAPAFREGFWEVEFHQLLRREGRTLWAAHAARADFGPSFRLSTFLRHRFRHGRQFAQARIAQKTRGRVALFAGAPVVPFLMAWRAARRVAGDRKHLARFALALPVFLLIAGSWAAGEAAGAWTGGRPAVTPAVTSPRSAK